VSRVVSIEREHAGRLLTQTIDANNGVEWGLVDHVIDASAPQLPDYEKLAGAIRY
jgi:hypothetical protein